jgi:hypothetical protein
MDHMENNASNTSSVLSIHCCRNMITELFLSNEERNRYRHTNYWEGFMRYATEMG